MIALNWFFHKWTILTQQNDWKIENSIQVETAAFYVLLAIENIGGLDSGSWYVRYIHIGLA